MSFVPICVYNVGIKLIIKMWITFYQLFLGKMGKFYGIALFLR